ncbi:hypothetical protein TNCV_4928331 [Trichonephila clavipes]|nr:hypothetical protein TNCV_4928331 [Trichonephila clavipes]
MTSFDYSIDYERFNLADRKRRSRKAKRRAADRVDQKRSIPSSLQSGRSEKRRKESTGGSGQCYLRCRLALFQSEELRIE